MYVNGTRRTVIYGMAEGRQEQVHLDAALTSVAAHGMLNSLGVARATISTLRIHWGNIDEETCLRLLLRAEAQLMFLGDNLADLVRGIPAEARQLLDGLPETRVEFE